jgi:formiminotetrahydrofolate cyclodeaminase
MPADPDQLARRPFDELLTELAAQTPAPGGGSAAAWTLGLSAALLEMACAFTLAHEAQPEHEERVRNVRARARALRVESLTCGQRDLRAFEGVLAAMRLPRADPEREARVRAALSDAAQSPLQIAGAGAELAELATELALTGNPNLLGDAATATLLAEAGCRAAATLVAINLRDAPEDPRNQEAQLLAARALDARNRLPARSD